MRVVVMGAGYVGLVSATCLSEFGFAVTCVDSHTEKIAGLKEGDVPIYEPGLESLLVANVGAGRLSFAGDVAEAVPEADVVILAVGTPSQPGDASANLTCVYEAANQLADTLAGYTVIASKSTVPVGTAREIARIIRERRPNANFDVVSNPEFLCEGSAIDTFMRPDRVIVGVDSTRPKSVMRALYRRFLSEKTPLLFTSLETAELTKYAANCFLATKIAYINEIAELCERIGVDVQDVALGVGLDSRIGRQFLRVGPGFGGSCLPKDTAVLARMAEDVGAPSGIARIVLCSNAARKVEIIDKIVRACGGSVAGKALALLGVTFKPDTDDMRESPGLVILPGLMERGATIHAFDPAGMDNARSVLEGVVWCPDTYETMVNADALIILTEWNEFRALNLCRVRRLLKTPLMVDLRNIYDPSEVAAACLRYVSVGRPPVGLDRAAVATTDPTAVRPKTDPGNSGSRRERQ